MKTWFQRTKNRRRKARLKGNAAPRYTESLIALIRRSLLGQRYGQ